MKEKRVSNRVNEAIEAWRRAWLAEFPDAQPSKRAVSRNSTYISPSNVDKKDITGQPVGDCIVSSSGKRVNAPAPAQRVNGGRFRQDAPTPQNLGIQPGTS
jgi:hypothetical protein